MDNDRHRDASRASAPTCSGEGVYSRRVQDGDGAWACPSGLFPQFREAREGEASEPRRRLFALPLPEWRLLVAASSDSDAVRRRTGLRLVTNGFGAGPVRFQSRLA